MNEAMKQELASLMEQAKTVYVYTDDEYGYHKTKAMFSLQRDRFAVHYFTTNKNSKRAAQLQSNPKDSNNK